MRHSYRPIGLLLAALLVGCTPQGSTSPSTAGPEQKGASSSEQGQKAAPQQVEQGRAYAFPAGNEAVYPQGPVHAEQDGMPPVEVDAQDIEHRRHREQGEEADLEPGPALLQAGPAHGAAAFGQPAGRGLPSSGKRQHWPAMALAKP